MIQQSVRPTAPITATGTNTTSSVPVAFLPGTSSGKTTKKVDTKTSPTSNTTSNKPVVVKSASNPHRKPRYMSKNVLCKTLSLPDLTDNQDISNNLLHSSRHPKSLD